LAQVPNAEPGGSAGNWAKRTPVKPDPSKIKVPAGYKVGVFASGLDTVTSITVDKSDNVWVAISGNTFGFPPEGIDKPHVKIFDKSGKLIKDKVGLGMFKSFALNEIAYCPENGRTYVGDYSYIATDTTPDGVGFATVPETAGINPAQRTRCTKTRSFVIRVPHASSVRIRRVRAYVQERLIGESHGSRVRLKLPSSKATTVPLPSWRAPGQ